METHIGNDKESVGKLGVESHEGGVDRGDGSGYHSLRSHIKQLRVAVPHSALVPAQARELVDRGEHEARISFSLFNSF